MTQTRCLSSEVPMSNVSRKRNRRGFTLVELLVVVSIIGILAAVVSTAVMGAIRAARQAAIFTEISQIGTSLEQYKAKYGSYPPASLTQNTEFEEYFQRMFPRYDVSRLSTDMTTAMQAVDSSYSYTGTSRTYAEAALVFWLVGFSGDPENPLAGHFERMRGTQKGSPLYEFEDDQLADGTYAVAGNTTHAERTLWYIDSRLYNTSNALNGLDFFPYRYRVDPDSDTDWKFYNPDSFQLVYPGRDGKLGKGAGTTSGYIPYLGDDEDNMTNFSGGNTMFDFTDE